MEQVYQQQPRKKVASAQPATRQLRRKRGRAVFTNGGAPMNSPLTGQHFGFWRFGFRLFFAARPVECAAGLPKFRALRATEEGARRGQFRLARLRIPRSPAKRVSFLPLFPLPCSLFPHPLFPFFSTLFRLCKDFEIARPTCLFLTLFPNPRSLDSASRAFESPSHAKRASLPPLFPVPRSFGLCLVRRPRPWTPPSPPRRLSIIRRRPTGSGVIRTSLCSRSAQPCSISYLGGSGYASFS